MQTAIEADSTKDISCSTKELQEWVKAGLVAKELLAPGKIPELLNFISKNKESLYNCYQDPQEENTCEIFLPPPDKWAETYELHVIDRKTGKIISTLDQVANLELTDNVLLRVKASELPLWKKETAEVKKFTKQQNESLKEFISKIGSTRPLTRKEIATFIKEIRKEHQKPQKYRQSSHLVEQKLKYPKDINQADLTFERTAEGIRLTEPEMKLEHALTKLLRDNSQNKNSRNKDFYTGNEESAIALYGGKEQKTPIIRCKRADLYRAYLCKKDYSGADAEYIDNLLIQFAEKKFLIKYDRTRRVKVGNNIEERTDRIEEFQALIRLLYFFPSLNAEEKALIDSGDLETREKKEELIIAFSPIFIDQVDSKFVEFPDDTNRRLMLAAGGHKCVTIAMHKLMEWSLREISAGRFTWEMNEENLVQMLGMGKYVKQNRKKLIKSGLLKAVEAIKKMGIILTAETLLNTKGETKWRFTLNKKYE